MYLRSKPLLGCLNSSFSVYRTPLLTTISRINYTSHKPIQKTTIRPSTMSSKGFSNTSDTPGPADPYKAKNKEDPELSEKVESLSEFISKCKFGMMTTRIADSGLLVSRCMALAAKESGGIDLIFHTNTESGKTDDLQSDSAINIAFLNSSGEWASISGEANILTDRATVKKYYSPQLKAWLGDLGDGKHDGGPDDPRIGIIQVKAKTATYAISRTNMITRGIEIVQGVLTGETAQVNKLIEITEDEINQWRSTH